MFVKGVKTMGLELYLGANTPYGFYPLFEQFADSMRRVFIIKGGPGSGKSTMMKRLASFGEEKGAETVRIYCSSDSDSLDGVWFPDHGILYADGTAPHVLEAKTPGAKDELIDFGQCFDTKGLEAQLDAIRDADRRLKAHYAQCYAYLAAAQKVKMQADRLGAADPALVKKKAAALVRRAIPKRKGAEKGKTFDVFLGSFTKNGLEQRMLPENYTCIPVFDPASAGMPLFEETAKKACDNGYTVLKAHDPYDPEKGIVHLLFPELKLAVVSSGRAFGYENAPGRRIHLEMRHPGAEKAQISRDRKLQKALEACASQALAEAKEVHDEIEALYWPYVRFEIADRITAQQLSYLSGIFSGHR